MKPNQLILLAGAVVALGLATPGQAQTLINFDDLNPGFGSQIANGYAGLNWDNFYALNSVTFTGTYGNSGYALGTVSTPNVAYNDFGSAASISSATPFALNSGYFTAAWFNGLNLEVIAKNGSAVVADNNYTLTTQNPDFVSFNLPDVTSVEFISSGGTSAGFDGNGTQFALDNLTINGPTLSAAPEPSQVLGGLLVTGLGGITFLVRRLRQGR